MSDDESCQRRSSRRPVNKVKDAKTSALERLKEARRSGRAYRERVDDIVQDVLVDVDEDEYNRMYRASDFVDDDDGAGYADSDEEEVATSSKEKKKAAKKEQKKDKKAGDITRFLRPDAKLVERAPTTSQVDDDTALAEALAQLEETVDDGTQVLDFFTEEAVSAPEPVTEWNDEEDTVTNVPEVFKPATIKRVRRMSDDDFTAKVAKIDEKTTLKTARQNESTFTASTHDKTLVSDTKNTLKDVKIKETLNNVSKPAFDDVEDSYDNGINDDNDISISQDVAMEEDMFDHTTVVEDVLEEEEEQFSSDNGANLNFYCLDFYENKGSVFMFGKMGTQSCCVEVKGIERIVYFVPIQEELDDLKREVTEVLRKSGISQFRSKETVIKYVPDGDDIDKEMKVFMVAYDGSLPALDIDLTGNYFKRVLNTSSSPLERLLMEAKLKTPCYLNIANSEIVENKKSNCEVEYTVNNKNLKNVTMSSSTKAPPRIRMLVLYAVTALVPSGQKEIVALSALYKKNAFIEKPNEKSPGGYEILNFIAKPTKGTLPIALNDVLKQKNMTDKVFIQQNERALLAAFLVKFKEMDPDLVVMHDAEEHLEFLKNKLTKHKISTYNFLSKMKRLLPIDKIKKYNMNVLTAGRLILCSKTAARELDNKCKSQDMDDLVLSLLLPNDAKISRRPLSPEELLEPFFSAKGLPAFFKLLKFCWYEAYLSLRVILQLNALPLFVRITKIVGGIMSRTLTRGRADRNEFLLLHAFHDRGYVPWDKKKSGGKDDDKSVYLGGKVLEPVKGLCENFVLLLDFNSLYPSIIQEYNICFTTIDKCYLDRTPENVLDSIPAKDIEQGILPKEIGELVRRRRVVKSEMKTTTDPDKYLQLDVEQLGLKLTANSMYGCLGFKGSRFYAKSMALMITVKGRALLDRNAEMVNKMGYPVLYGDTDSIMINSQLDKHSEAKELAYRIAKDLNGPFKYVEMGVDGMFKKLLLLKKKAYMALTMVNMNDPNTVKMEIKGSQLVKRDCSELVKKICRRVLGIIMGSAEVDTKVTEVINVLSEWRRRLFAGEFELSDFEIYQQLNKDVSEYNDNGLLVNLAKRLNQSGKYNLKKNDMIRYIICEDGSTYSDSKRAYHTDEVEAALKKVPEKADTDDKENVKPSEPNLKIDYMYYVDKTFTFVNGICDVIEWLDQERIVTALGMDASKIKRRGQTTNYSAFDVCYQSEEYEGFSFECPGCQKVVIVRSPIEIKDGHIVYTMKNCLECNHDLTPDRPYLLTRLHEILHEHISRFNKAPYVCTDSGCGHEETDVCKLNWTSNKYVPKCSKCDGTLAKEFDLIQLSEQQRSYHNLFDIETFTKQAKTNLKKRLEDDPNYKSVKQFYGQLLEIVDDRWRQNKASKVDLSSLFRGFQLK
ncbi:unnamed protein product [Bursaphelenchus okinawaensis]|uniref:DNA polymerase n=1 Tax=Bursaphelenchus okinawaensis TaxID=465554 RepID=A0A811JU02_9BILA|nr:unnamed protein product [Bursaphelenchus okinawaensis]CAG9083397.1 unnamed protein product [Bursaphelenchus okinawaensis]